MPRPKAHTTVQARILAYVQQIGGTYVSRAEAEERRGFDASAPINEAKARTASLFAEAVLHPQAAPLALMPGQISA